MRIACVSFTYSGDASKAAIANSLLPDNWDKFWCLASKDANLPLPNNVNAIIKDFNRGRCLNIPEAIKGMQSVYVDLYNMGYDIIIKLDSDTALYRPDCFTNPIVYSNCDFTYIRRAPFECKTGLCNGSCYAMSKNAVSKLVSANLDEIIKLKDGHEDLIFSYFFLVEQANSLLVSQLNKFRIDWSALNYDKPDIIMGHYGYVTPAAMFINVNSILKKYFNKALDKTSLEAYFEILSKFICESPA